MTIQENKNCEQRIQESMDYTELHIKAMFAVAHDEIDDLDDEDSDDMEVLKYINTNDVNDTDIYEYSLGTDIHKSHRIHLSTGGPASFIEVITDDQDNIENVYYHFQDWFDGAEMQVKESDPMWEFAESILAWNIDGYN